MYRGLKCLQDGSRPSHLLSANPEIEPFNPQDTKFFSRTRHITYGEKWISLNRIPALYRGRMLYLACLIRAREPEDKSGWLEDVSPLRVVNREFGPSPLPSLEYRPFWIHPGLFNSKRNSVDEGVILLYIDPQARGRCTRGTSFIYSFI